ncbi:MAG TPA: LysE family transporter [Dehalococcoidia bacterium]|nr:LysE family transporter [Dehalococcoidia bacterium]
MDTTLSLGQFLLMAAGISLTGVMLPGPMTAATIAKGCSAKHAGVWIAAGHAVIEIPLIAVMAVIYFGSGRFVSSPQVEKAIYLVGGLMLLYLGFRMFRGTRETSGAAGGLPTSPLVTGIVITGTNPSFYIWWVTAGAVLITGAAEFGPVGVVLLAAVHLPSDFLWSEFLSVGTFESRRWWTQRVQRIVFGVCALILAGFGVWFCISAFL